MKGYLLLFFVVLNAVRALGQNELYDEPVVVYNRQHYGGVQLSTNGYGAFFNYGINKGAFKARIFNFELSAVKHEKEAKSFSNDPNARSYFYGKKNSLFALRAGFGQKKSVSEKLRKNGVQVGRSWVLGPLLGFTKPVYLEVLYSDEQEIPTFFLEVERFDPDKHYPENIYGRASGLRGLGEMRVNPGIYARYAWHFEYSNYKDGLKGIEVGAGLDMYPARVEIMSEKILEEFGEGARNHQFFLSLYINVFLGRKYNLD
jgi:hypothetical protein